MEDTLIYPKEYCYQFRLDIVSITYELDLESHNHIIEYAEDYELAGYGINPESHNLEQCAMERFYVEKIPPTIDLNTPLGYLHKKHMVKINRFLELFSHYLICLESSDQDKVHYQGILWTKQQLELTTTLDKVKQRFFPLQKTKFKQNSVSLTSAKKIKNLGSYIKKDKHIVKTNMTQSKILMFPQWKTTEQLKEKWNNQLIEKIEACNKDGLTAKQTANILVEYSWENNRMHPTRARMQYLLGKYHNNYGSENIVIGYRLFPETY